MTTSEQYVSIFINHDTLEAQHCVVGVGRVNGVHPNYPRSAGWKHFVSFALDGRPDVATAKLDQEKVRGVQHVREYWAELGEDKARHVVFDGHLYVVFDPATMVDLGGASHRVRWLQDDREEVCRLVPQGRVPVFARTRFPDNVAFAEYID